MATKSPANRGKKAEGIVKDALNDMNKHNANFTFNRVPDAHAAGGRFPAQAGDFQAFAKYTGTGLAIDLGQYSRNFIIEVKEVKHDFRLAHKNYSADKVARVEKRVWAGTEAIVAVLHTTNNTWRLVPLEVFLDRTGASWDLRGFPVLEVSIGQALADWMGVKP